MTFLIDDQEKTGISFIDQGHPVIAEYVNKICQEAQNGRDIAYIIQIFDDLTDKIGPYLSEKSKCRTENACEKQSVSHETIELLIDLRNLISKFGHDMTPDNIIDEIKKWALNHVFESDIKCSECAKTMN